MPKHHYKESKPKFIWPVLAVSLGIIISILSGYVLAVITSLTNSFLWLFIISGCVFSVFLAILIRQHQFIRGYRRTLSRISTDFQKEIDDRLHAEETKQKLERALLHGQKLQAIGTLAGGIAHDFNNLLYAVMGYVDMAREDVPKDTIVFDNLGKVIKAAQRGQELIARILAFSRRQHHEFNPICLKETIEGVLSLLKPTIPASCLIEFQTNPSLDCKILGNETQLHQIIVNIINNAVDAMDGEGTITIALSQILADDEFLEQFPNSSKLNYCKIELSDTGHGMDQATKERIFEPFFTTKEVGKGTGLGLATVHAIVNEHKGEIIVTSQLGHGTRFTILLPEFIHKEQHNGENFIG